MKLSCGEHLLFKNASLQLEIFKCRKTVFLSKWLHRLDKTGKVCSCWLIKGKTTSPFKCIVCNATKMLEERSARLAAAINNKKFNDIRTAEVLVTPANDKLHILKTKLIENSENLNRLRKKQKK